MDVFTQNKILIRVIIVLVVFNLIFIALILREDFRPRSHQSPKINGKGDISALLKRELNLDENQTRQIRDLRLAFFEKERILASAIRSERDSMNELMFSNNTNDLQIKSLAKRIADNDNQMELLRYEQALKLKSICTPVQLEKFNGLVKEIRDYFRPDPKPDKK